MKETRSRYDTDLTSPPKGKIHFEAYLAWVDEDVRAEWEDGEVVVMAPAAKRHQDLVLWLSTVLSLFVQHHGLGSVVIAPFVVRLRMTDQGREPDLLFVRSENLERLGETYLDGPADLIVEVASPESFGRDRGRKYVEYEAEGVQEYWLLDPARLQAEFYRLGPDGLYRPVLLQDGIYRSGAVHGFWLQIDWLWQEPLPSALDVLRHLGVSD